MKVLMGIVLVIFLMAIFQRSSDNSVNKITDGFGNTVQNSSKIITGYDVSHEPVYDRKGNMIGVDQKTNPVIIKILVVGAIIYGIFFHKKSEPKKEEKKEEKKS